ncbi:MAG TPA: LysR family transcriptional regulator [Stellaceae bacterium]|nr:LysR family transcriptional regulator [Stellaceae bacterium]
MSINLTLQHLACFLRVSETGSFTQSGRALGLSQPALSRTIQQMEAMLGARLFDRDTRNVMLTPTGLALRPIAERMLGEFSGAYGELAEFIAGRRGRVVVATLPSLAAVLLAPAVARFQAGYPDVAVAIQDGLAESVIEAVAAGRADLGLTVQATLDDRLTYQPLLEDTFGMVCRADDPLASSGVVDWTVFRSRPFVAMAAASSVRRMTDAAFLQAGLAVPALYECSFLGTTGHLVAAGLGITALPWLTLPLLGPAPLVWRRLERPVMRRSMGVVTRIGRTPAPPTENLLAAMRREAAALQSYPPDGAS